MARCVRFAPYAFCSGKEECCSVVRFDGLPLQKAEPMIEKVSITFLASKCYIQFRKQPPVLVARGVSVIR